MIRIDGFARVILFLLVIVSATQIFSVLFPGRYNYLDEILLLLLFPIYLINFKKIRISKAKAYLTFCLILFSLISLVVNYYSYEAFLIKTQYYLKTALVIFIVSFLSSNYLTTRYRNLIFYVILGICCLSLIEWLYIQFAYFSDEVQWSLVGIFLKSRGGIYRAQSLTGHPISLGMAGLFGLVYTIERTEKRKVWKVAVFLLSVLASGSRVPTLLIIVYFLMKSRDWLLPYLNIRLGSIYLFGAVLISTVAIPFVDQYLEDNNEVTSTRGMSISKAKGEFSNPRYFIMGFGVGSYGMYESVEYDSPIYKLLDYPLKYKTILTTSNRGTGMESFLFMVLFELGVVGMLLYYSMFIPFHSKISTLSIFISIVVIFSSLFYPIYTLPFVFLVGVLFDNIYYPFNTNEENF